MNAYMPMTGNQCKTATLLVNTEAPLHELHASAYYRIQAVTQLMESVAHKDCSCVDLHSFSVEASILLRDGCDLLDVLGRRLREL